MKSTEKTLVAKFGGTSMAQPELAAAQLEYEQNAVGIVVVSAPGTDKEHSTKTTDMLLGYKDRLCSNEEIQRRYERILARTAMADDLDSLKVVSRIPSDLGEWASRNDPVEALGEYWSAQLFASRTGREFVDAREIILFDSKGKLDETATFAAVRSRLGDGRKYVVPGFYGSCPDGSIQPFERGGSDITGAIIAKAMQADAYHNWSDVAGFITADPRKVTEARLLSRITYREARELGNGGSELLHRTVIKYLGGTGIKTLMRKTFGKLGNAGTEIVDSRAWQQQPIIGVTGRADLIVLNLHEFGLNEGIGETLDVVQALKDKEIPYEHSNDATDDVSIYVDHKYIKGIESIAQEQLPLGRTLQISNAGLIHVVGEGLARSSSFRLGALGAVCTAFYDAGLEGMGVSDVGGSATQTLFVHPEVLGDALGLAHRALGLNKK